MDKELLAMIVTNSAPNKSPMHPHGFCYVPEIQHERLQALEAAGHAQVAWNAPGADKSVPVKLTDSGVKLHSEPAPAPRTAQHPAFQMPVTIEDNVPLPPTQRFGRAASGQSAVEKYPFNELRIGQSFFVPGTPGADKPMHRTFSSVVSQANRKLYPKDFAIRPDKHNGLDGARVWRKEDLTGPRPQRARKAKAEDQPQTAQDAPFGPTPGVGGSGAFGSSPAIGSAPAFGSLLALPGMPSAFGAAPGAPTAFPAPGPGFAAPQSTAAGDAWANGPAFGEALSEVE